MKTREVEFARLWDDNTWDTDTADISKKLVDVAEKTGDTKEAMRAAFEAGRKSVLGELDPKDDR